jgi:hypothetical protein
LPAAFGGVGWASNTGIEKRKTSRYRRSDAAVFIARVRSRKFALVVVIARLTILELIVNKVAYLSGGGSVHETRLLVGKIYGKCQETNEYKASTCSQSSANSRDTVTCGDFLIHFGEAIDTGYFVATRTKLKPISSAINRVQSSVDIENALPHAQRRLLDLCDELHSSTFREGVPRLLFYRAKQL